MHSGLGGQNNGHWWLLISDLAFFSHCLTMDDKNMWLSYLYLGSTRGHFYFYFVIWQDQEWISKSWNRHCVCVCVCVFFLIVSICGNTSGLAMCRSNIGGWESLKLEQYICSSTLRILDWKKAIELKDALLGHSAGASTSPFASGKLWCLGYCLVFHLESKSSYICIFLIWGDIEWHLVPSAILFIDVCHLAN